MKTVITLFAIAISLNTFSQVKGFDAYTTLGSRDYDAEKQHILDEDSYEFILSDGQNARISMQLFEIMWSELERVYAENGLTIPEGRVLAREDGALNIKATKETIAKAIKSRGQLIMFEFDFKDGYRATINLQDEFCAFGIDKKPGYVDYQ